MWSLPSQIHVVVYIFERFDNAKIPLGIPDFGRLLGFWVHKQGLKHQSWRWISWDKKLMTTPELCPESTFSHIVISLQI